MSRSRRRQTFSKVTAVKSNARDRIGSPKATFIITPKNKRPERFEKSWIENLDEEEEIELIRIEDLDNGNIKIY
jgi:hypothetical protein